MGGGGEREEREGGKKSGEDKKTQVEKSLLAVLKPTDKYNNN